MAYEALNLEMNPVLYERCILDPSGTADFQAMLDSRRSVQPVFPHDIKHRMDWNSIISIQLGDPLLISKAP